MKTSPDKSMPLHIRKYRFQLSPEKIECWYDGDTIKSLFFNSMSVYFPMGESFFIKIIRKFYSKLENDPDLINQCNLFIKQEASHSSMHVNYNKILKNNGYDIDKFIKLQEAADRIEIKYLSEISLMAIVAGLEFSTSIMGEWVVKNDPFKNSEKSFARLWNLHALEELEHSHVSFNVYKAIGGGYFRRVIFFLYVNMLTNSLIFMSYIHMVKKDKSMTRFSQIKAVLKFMLCPSGIVFYTFKRMFAYLKPGFHPLSSKTGAASELLKFEKKNGFYGDRAP